MDLGFNAGLFGLRLIVGGGIVAVVGREDLLLGGPAIIIAVGVVVDGVRGGHEGGG